MKAHAQGTPNVRLSLFLPMPRPIEAGDTFAITAGCDKRFETCRNRFANVINFGGFPHMPGNDFALGYVKQGDNNSGGSLNGLRKPASMPCAGQSIACSPPTFGRSISK